MNSLFKIFLIVVLSVFSTLNLSANDTFFSIEKSSERLEELANAGSNWFSLSSFKNITAKIPGGANKTNIGKTLWNDAYKITPTNGSSAKNVVDDIIVNGDNLGAKTEGLVDDIMTGQGYQIADGKYYGANGVNGYDGIYYKGGIDNPSEIIIIESKQMSSSGSASLSGPNTNTGLPSQMSDNWINYVATDKLDGLGGLKQQTADAIISASNGSIQKYVAVVDKTTGEINFIKLANF